MLFFKSKQKIMQSDLETLDIMAAGTAVPAEIIHRLITQDIPNRVAADTAYQNAKNNSDPQNARIEHDKALMRVMMSVLKDDTELFKQFSDNESFRRWMTDTIFAMTYDIPPPVSPGHTASQPTM